MKKSKEKIEIKEEINKIVAFAVVFAFYFKGGSRIIIKGDKIMPFKNYLLYDTTIVDLCYPNKIKLADIDHLRIEKQGLTEVEAANLDCVRISEEDFDKYFLHKEFSGGKIFSVFAELYGSENPNYKYEYEDYIE